MYYMDTCITLGNSTNGWMRGLGEGGRVEIGELGRVWTVSVIGNGP